MGVSSFFKPLLYPACGLSGTVCLRREFDSGVPVVSSGMGGEGGSLMVVFLSFLLRKGAVGSWLQARGRPLFFVCASER